MKYATLILLLMCCFAEVCFSQENLSIKAKPKLSLSNIYIPTLKEMKYKSTAVSFGIFCTETPFEDSVPSGGGGVFGGMTGRFSTGYIANRVAIEFSAGMLVRQVGIEGWAGLGTNIRIKDWDVVNASKENASLLRLGLRNDVVLAQNIANRQKLDVIFRMKHQLVLEWFLYKRNQSMYVAVGFISSPYRSVSYANGAMAIEVGLRLFTPHNKGAIFERDLSEISQLPIREK